jgi:aspartate/methionine/tyrosine aminotransferase
MAAHGDVAARCWGLRDYVSLSPGKLNDALAVVAMRYRQAIFQRNEGIITRNLATANAWVEEHAELVSWKPPRAGLLALLHYRLDIPSLELANKLAEEYSVMLAPGSAFGFEQYLRVGIGQAPAVFTAGLAAAATCFAELQAAGVGLVEDPE